eukprot:1150583-Pelagomonas_calceolata.AAC.2
MGLLESGRRPKQLAELSHPRTGEASNLVAVLFIVLIVSSTIAADEQELALEVLVARLAVLKHSYIGAETRRKLYHSTSFVDNIVHTKDAISMEERNKRTDADTPRRSTPRRYKCTSRRCTPRGCMPRRSDAHPKNSHPGDTDAHHGAAQQGGVGTSKIVHDRQSLAKV